MGAVRGRFPIPRSRRGLLVAAAALVVVLGGAAAGLTVALTRASGGSGLTKASFPGYQFEFSYPSGWQSVEWCWLATTYFPLTLLTTANPAPTCVPNTIFGFGTPLPPPQRLAANGVTVWWIAAARSALGGRKPNTSIDGRAARVTVTNESTRRTARSLVNCPRKQATQRALTALIDGAAPGARRIRVGAVVCGPDFASGLADVRTMLDSLRFTS
jgi:hypothetical protein